jgi:hypothetical protein
MFQMIRLKILESARQVGTGLNSQHPRLVLIDNKYMLQLLAKDSTSEAWVSEANFAIMVLTKSDYGFKMLDAGRALKYAASCMERRCWIGFVYWN